METGLESPEALFPPAVPGDGIDDEKSLHAAFDRTYITGQRKSKAEDAVQDSDFLSLDSARRQKISFGRERDVDSVFFSPDMKRCAGKPRDDLRPLFSSPIKGGAQL
jgi:hypothetical protein